MLTLTIAEAYRPAWLPLQVQDIPHKFQGGYSTEALLTAFRSRLRFRTLTTSPLKMKKEKQHVAMCKQNHSRWVSGRHTRAEIHRAKQAGMQLQPRGERTMEGLRRRPS